ncbi:MAG TPA: hypothetical protein VL068_06190, partial [Microthrixaceae bacterium]|nr:hypothetical protein [Microthrixaceae bacterium]
ADALRRIETMVLLGAEQLSSEAVRAQVYSAIDVLVGVQRRSDGTRQVDSIHSLSTAGQLTRLYEEPDT